MKSTSLSSLKDSLEEETGSVFAERVDGEVPGASTFSVKLFCCSLLQDSSPGRVESKKSVFPSEKRIGQDNSKHLARIILVNNTTICKLSDDTLFQTKWPLLLRLISVRKLKPEGVII